MDVSIGTAINFVQFAEAAGVPEAVLSLVQEVCPRSNELSQVVEIWTILPVKPLAPETPGWTNKNIGQEVGAVTFVCKFK